MLDPIEIWEICWLDPRLELFLMFLEPFPSSFCRRRAAAIRECCWHDGMYFVCSAALQMSGYITPAQHQHADVSSKHHCDSAQPHRGASMDGLRFIIQFVCLFHTFLNSDNCLDAFQFNNVAIGSGYLCVLQIGSELPLLNLPSSVCASTTNQRIQLAGDHIYETSLDFDEALSKATPMYFMKACKASHHPY